LGSAGPGPASRRDLLTARDPTRSAHVHQLGQLGHHGVFGRLGARLSLAGKLTERFGRRRFFLASVVVFAGASLCCGLAGNIYLLIVLRAIQAASWRGIFFVNVPIGILVLLGIGALALMLGISYLGEAGASAASPWFVVPVIAGLLGLALFGRHIRRVQDPFIAPRLIAGRGFGAVNVINILYGGAVAGMLALVPLYAVDRYRISVPGSGTLLTAEGIAVIATSSLAAMGLRRIGYRWPL
jgi:MFS family permease